MATFPEHPANEPGRTPERRADRADETMLAAVAGGSSAWAIGGALAAILAILGLAGMWTTWMIALATIIVGVAFLMHGMGIMARNMQVVSRAGGSLEHAEAAFGVSPEFLSGSAGVVLGVLALVGIDPILLCAIAVLTFGAALFFGATPRIQAGAVTAETSRAPEAGRSLFARSTSAHLMVGLGVMALGILAIYGIRPEVLTLVGLLSVGSAILLTGSAIAYRMATRLSHVRERVHI